MKSERNEKRAMGLHRVPSAEKEALPHHEGVFGKGHIIID